MVTLLIIIGIVLIVGFLIVTAAAGIAALLIDPLICILIVVTIYKIITSLRKEKTNGTENKTEEI